MPSKFNRPLPPHLASAANSHQAAEDIDSIGDNPYIEGTKGVSVPAAPHPAGTVFFVFGALITWSTLNGEQPTDILRWAAYGMGISLAITILYDLTLGIRNLMRADLILMLAIYGLLFAEFLFPQDFFNLDNTVSAINQACNASIFAYIAVAVSRHLGVQREFSSSSLFTAPVSPYLIVRLFFACFIIGFLHQWIAVKFNLVHWIEYWLGPRFSQPWARGKYGGWHTILFELGMLQYVVSPLAAIILVRRHIYPAYIRTLVAICFLLVVAHAFCGGTRHIFAVHLIMAAASYCYFQRLTPKFVIIGMTVLMTVIYFSCNLMIGFRQIGLRNYIDYKKQGYTFQTEESSLQVDYNMQTLSWLMDQVPEKYDYLGLEVPYMALVRPIPRAIWKNKPEGLSTSLEKILWRPGTGGTWSVTYIGEAFLAYGHFAYIALSMLLGWGATTWNRFASLKNSDLGVLIYASGFFSFAIAVRSILSYTTAILPTLALLFFANYLFRNRSGVLPLKKESSASELGNPAASPPKPPKSR